MPAWKFFAFKPTMETVTALGMVLLGIAVNLMANAAKGTGIYFLLYQGVLILGICIFLPLWYFRQHNHQSMVELGITSKGWGKALIIGLIFAGITVPFRLVDRSFLSPEFAAFAYTAVGLAMTSLAEEVFFRGYLQTRFEKAFGTIPAVILSGLSFSLYHLGYRDFRTLPELGVMFIVGILFALVFRITRNVITSFTLNFPHALISFMEKGITLPATSAVISGIVLIIALGIIRRFANQTAKS